MDRPPDPLRLYALVRTDLGMSPGKIASQAGHAYVDTIRRSMAHAPEVTDAYFSEAGGHGIKICLACPSLQKLLRAHDAAKAVGLPCALITDLGYTVFEGKETITALGIGPAREADVRAITKKFRLMP